MSHKFHCFIASHSPTSAAVQINISFSTPYTSGGVARSPSTQTPTVDYLLSDYRQRPSDGCLPRARGCGSLVGICGLTRTSNLWIRTSLPCKGQSTVTEPGLAEMLLLLTPTYRPDSLPGGPDTPACIRRLECRVLHSLLDPADADDIRLLVSLLSCRLLCPRVLSSCTVSLTDELVQRGFTLTV